MIGALGFVIALVGLVLIVTTLTGTTGQVIASLIGGGTPPGIPASTTGSSGTGTGVTGSVVG